MLAPICLFTYNRLVETQKTVTALQQNYLAKKSDLFVFSDGPKNNQQSEKVDEVRKYLKTITGFRSVTFIESTTNKGLAYSIISGVTDIINKHLKIIVVEDDLVTSPNFLDFINQALDYYENNERILSISGYTMSLPSLKYYSHDFYLGIRASSLGWGTWRNRWEDADWKVMDYQVFKLSFVQQLKFMRGGSDLPRMLKKQMHGTIDSWAIRWCYHQFKNKLFTVFPSKSKLIHIGYSEEASNTKDSLNRFNTFLDTSQKTRFQFENELNIDNKLLREFRQKFSIINRLKDKLR